MCEDLMWHQRHVDSGDKHKDIFLAMQILEHNIQHKIGKFSIT